MPFRIPQFSSKRFNMRLMTLADKDFYIKLHQDPITCQFVGGVLPEDKALQEFNFSLRLNRKGSILTFMITNLIHSNTENTQTQCLIQQPLGLCALVWNKYRTSVEMGIYLSSEHFGQGIAQEVLAELLSFAFNDLDIANIMIRTEVNNTAMINTILGLPYPLHKTDTEYCWQIDNPLHK